MLLPAVPETLKCYCNEQMDVINKFIAENYTAESEDSTNDGGKTDL